MSLMGRFQNRSRTGPGMDEDLDEYPDPEEEGSGQDRGLAPLYPRDRGRGLVRDEDDDADDDRLPDSLWPEELYPEYGTSVRLEFEQAVRDAQEDPQAFLSLSQAAIDPVRLYYQWKNFTDHFAGRVETFNNWMKIVLPGLVVSVVLFYVEFFFVPPPHLGAMIFQGALALLLGCGLSYWIWLRIAFMSTYVKVLVMGRYNFIDASQCHEILILWCQRMTFALRSDVFVGNNGMNGIKDRDSYIRLKTPFGMVVKDITHVREVYDLEKDNVGMQYASASTRYNLYRMAENLGTLVSEFHEGNSREAIAAFVTNNFPWFLSAGIMAVGLLIFLQMMG